MKVGIFIGGTPDREYDCREIIEKGNPGIGGTQYEFIAIATYLGDFGPNAGIDLIVYQQGRYLLKDNIKQRFVKINSLSSMSQIAADDEVDIMIINSGWPLSAIKNFNKTNIKVILWNHCVGSYYRQFSFARWKAIKAEVFVSRGHLLNFLDSPINIAKKATYIYNAVSVPTFPAEMYKTWNARGNNVVYMGALDESKGFHVLAKAWPNVVKKVPDAKLYVIGSASLYGGNPELGNLGVAAKKYEESFSEYITDVDGKLMSSIILCGKLSDKKYDIMSSCKIGVPNPCGKTETFCICAVEMQLSGCKIVTHWSSGYIDTCPAPPATLLKDGESLSNAIVDVLLSSDTDNEEHVSRLSNKFNCLSIGSEWIELIKKVDSGVDLRKKYDIPQEFKSRDFNRIIRTYLPFVSPKGLLEDSLGRFWGVVKRKLKL